MNYYENCTLCPRRCGVNRTKAHGACGMGGTIYAARAALHMWEEPCISGSFGSEETSASPSSATPARAGSEETSASLSSATPARAGSGTVFFVGCPLGCVFCQNREISRGKGGVPVSTDALADIFLRLQDEQHANNVNLVTATHFTPTVADAIKLAKSRGLKIPVVWNSSGYESVKTLRLLDGLVDVYLPDLKYFSSELSAKYSHAPDYFEVACAALDEMFRQVGEPQFADGSDDLESGIMVRGMIVRHLVLPTHTDDSRRVIEYLHSRFGDSVYISIMNQYTPVCELPYPELSRPITDEEYDSVVDYAADLGVTNGFIQDGGTVAESFIPAFDGEGITSPGN